MTLEVGISLSSSPCILGGPGLGDRVVAIFLQAPKFPPLQFARPPGLALFGVVAIFRKFCKLFACLLPAQCRGLLSLLVSFFGVWILPALDTRPLEPFAESGYDDYGAAQRCLEGSGLTAAGTSVGPLPPPPPGFLFRGLI